MLVGSTCNFLLSLNTSFVRFVSQVSVMDPPAPHTHTHICCCALAPSAGQPLPSHDLMDQTSVNLDLMKTQKKMQQQVCTYSMSHT